MPCLYIKYSSVFLLVQSLPEPSLIMALIPSLISSPGPLHLSDIGYLPQVAIYLSFPISGQLCPKYLSLLLSITFLLSPSPVILSKIVTLPSQVHTPSFHICFIIDLMTHHKLYI